MKKSISRSLCVSTVGVACLFAATSAHALNVNVAPNGNIQAAIDQVSAAGGGAVNITSGSATISASIRLRSNVTLNGAGNPATTLNAGGDFTVIVQNTEGLSNVALQNIKVAGRGGTGSTNCQGFFMSALATRFTNVRATNVQLLNFGGIACHYKRADNSSIANCNFHDNGRDLLAHNLYIRECASTNVTGSNLNNSPFGSGFHLAGVTTNGSIRTTNCNNNGQDGMNIQDTPSNYTVDGCTTNGNRNATSGRSDGIGINAERGTGTIRNCISTGNAGLNYRIGAGYTQSNNH